MKVIDSSDVQIFVSISSLVFLILFIIWSSRSWLNVFIRVGLFLMLLFGLAILFFGNL